MTTINYKARLIDLRGSILALGNSEVSLLISYNKYLVSCGYQKITLSDLHNENNISLFIEYGNYNKIGEEI